MHFLLNNNKHAMTVFLFKVNMIPYGILYNLHFCVQKSAF